MEYLEIIETIIPYVINQILMGVEDKIVQKLEIDSSASYSLDLAFKILKHVAFDPTSQNYSEQEEGEPKNVSKERHRAYNLKYIQPPKGQVTPRVEEPPKHIFMMPTQLWEDYEPQLIRQKTKEYVEEYPDERRIMEQKCLEKQYKEQKLRQQSREKRQVKELHTQLIMKIGSKEYTYDYNCNPLARSNNQVKKDVITTLPYEIPLTDNNSIISQPKLIEQVKQKRRQVENIETIMEFEEEQVQEIKLQPGVRLSLKPIQLQEQSVRLQTQKSKQPDASSISQKIPKKYKNVVKLNNINLVGYLQQQEGDSYIKVGSIATNQTQQISPTNQSFIDQETIKQDLLRLPKLRSHSINPKTKRKSRLYPSYSIVTYRD
ncbi:unnamed protein product [Paramecium octaurelia]|uniref:Uncharacterized protein n=1 Tax=Paramecium octaurelia TaxID=43137 RepID=A0A8S1SRT8_PAROT|nr:unnamed protein product [Paramecium octaurelia]